MATSSLLKLAFATVLPQATLLSQMMATLSAPPLRTVERGQRWRRDLTARQLATVSTLNLMLTWATPSAEVGESIVDRIVSSVGAELLSSMTRSALLSVNRSTIMSVTLCS